ncbi:MAG: hypothetical protein RLZ44_1008 [Pseudomonadota bacterium]|jgi:multicomponent Na+:H+ antiporter subunit F
MTEVLTLAALLLALTLLLGLIPVLRARRTAERMLAGQLLGTTGVGLLLLLAPLLQLPALRDVALVLALLAAVALAAFTRRLRGDADA